MATYVVSDIHGYYELFLKGLSEICFSENDFLWCLGDAIDKGPDGIKVLQHIMSSDNMDMIIGNHEYMMINAVSASGESGYNNVDMALWLDGNDGGSTYSAFEQLSIEEQTSILKWLKQRYVIKTLEVNGRRFCLSHSFYAPKCENKRFCELKAGDVWNVTWSSIWRDDYLTGAMDIYNRYKYTFIIGHVPVQLVRRWHEGMDEWNILTGYRHHNMINIDGGCAIGKSKEYQNGIIILKLDDMTEHAVQLSD